MSFPLIIVALSLLVFVLAPVLHAVQNLIGSAYYPALVKMWELWDSFQPIWFEFKTHRQASYHNAKVTDEERIRAALDAMMADMPPLEPKPNVAEKYMSILPTDVPEPPAHLFDNVIYLNPQSRILSTQPPIRSTHGSPRNRSSQPLHRQQTGNQHGSQGPERQQYAQSRRQRHQPNPSHSIFQVRI